MEVFISFYSGNITYRTPIGYIYTWGTLQCHVRFSEANSIASSPKYSAKAAAALMAIILKVSTCFNHFPEKRKVKSEVVEVVLSWSFMYFLSFEMGCFMTFRFWFGALMPDRPRWAWLLDPGGFRVKIHIYPKLMNRYEQFFDEQIWQHWWKDMKNPTKPLNFLIHNSRFRGWPNPGCAIQDPSTKMVQFSQQPRACRSSILTHHGMITYNQWCGNSEYILS